MEPSKKQKLGLIVSDLEGTLTQNYSFWMNLNRELGMSPEEDEALYGEFIEHQDYKRWMEKIISRWKEINKNSPSKLKRKAFHEFYKNHLLRFREERSTESIDYLEEQYKVTATLSEEVAGVPGVVKAEKRLFFETTAYEGYGVIYPPFSSGGYYFKKPQVTSSCKSSRRRVR